MVLIVGRKFQSYIFSIIFDDHVTRFEKLNTYYGFNKSVAFILKKIVTIWFLFKCDWGWKKKS